MGFMAPTAFEAAGSDQHRACLTRLCCASGLSQTLDAFFLPEPSRLCFTPYTLMGFLSSEVFPPDPPARLSTVLPLVTFLVDRAPGDMKDPSNPAALTTAPALLEGGPGDSIRGVGESSCSWVTVPARPVPVLSDGAPHFQEIPPRGDDPRCSGDAASAPSPGFSGRTPPRRRFP